MQDAQLACEMHIHANLFIRPSICPSICPLGISLSVYLCICCADPSDVQLRHALANLIALTFSLPPRSTHLWYFLFDQSELEDTYLPGFMVRSSLRAEMWWVVLTLVLSWLLLLFTSYKTTDLAHFAIVVIMNATPPLLAVPYKSGSKQNVV